jgi:hypothetical protein
MYGILTYTAVLKEIEYHMSRAKQESGNNVLRRISHVRNGT